MGIRFIGGLSKNTSKSLFSEPLLLSEIFQVFVWQLKFNGTCSGDRVQEWSRLSHHSIFGFPCDPPLLNRVHYFMYSFLCYNHGNLNHLFPAEIGDEWSSLFVGYFVGSVCLNACLLTWLQFNQFFCFLPTLVSQLADSCCLQLRSLS